MPSKPIYIAFYKPYNVLSQFTSEEDVRNLSEFNLPKDVYAAGRLDKDSEGLLILTNDGKIQSLITDPKHSHEKTYLVQVERIPSEEDLNKLRKGVVIKGKKTKPAKIKLVSPPSINERIPPIRHRETVPTQWLEIKISEGMNRQVRRMTAKIGFPTLRLIRVSIMNYNLLDNLKEGEFKEINLEELLGPDHKQL